jgi:hypothetical protein
LARLRIREVAQARGFTFSKFQRAADLPMSTARRYWHSSRTGRAQDAGTLRGISLDLLNDIATLLGVQPGDLVQADEE